MNSKPNRQYQLQKISTGNVGRKTQKNRRPYWLPAPGYYVLTTAVVIAFFFLSWEFLHESGEEMPWISAGIGASFLLGVAVFLREVILRRARNRVILIEKRLDYNLKNIPVKPRSVHNTNKLSIGQNADIVNNIQLKSEAAKVLGKLADGHLEVFEICDEYLRVNRNELDNVGIGSPRIAILRRSKEVVEEIHRFHLLSWAEIESKSLTRKAETLTDLPEKIQFANNALSVLKIAAQYYPNDLKIIESENAIKEFIASIEISFWIEQAERSAFKGNYKKAISHYKDALYFLAREDLPVVDKQSIADKINSEIEVLKDSAKKKSSKIINSRVKLKNIND